jgi:integrase
VLPSFSGGNVLIAILGAPFKCPPARRGAFLLHAYLVDRGVRDATRIDVISAMETPIPVSPETSVAIVHALAERDIGFTGHETGMRRGEVVGLRWQICRLRRPASIRCPADHRDSRTARRRNTQKLGAGLG